MELLHFADGLRSSEHDFEALKLAMVASGVDVRTLFPVESQADEWSGDPADDEDTDFDYSAVDWQPDASPTDWERMQAALADTRITVRDPGAVADAPLGAPDEPDREWT